MKPDSAPPAKILRLLQPFSAVALIVGIVIGAGIFKTPSLVAGISGDAGWALVLWMVGALISIAGALCYAELCTAYPNAGGDYHFLHRAFGRNISFIYGWSRATIINTGSIALLAFVFGDYMSTLVNLGTYSSAVWALLIVIVLTVVNLAGIHASSSMQTWLTLIEIVGLLAVVAAGFWVDAPASGALQWFAQAPAPAQWGLCLVFVLLTFGGWNEAAYISAELKGGPRTMVWVILASMLTLTVIYLLVNTALLFGLGLNGLSQSKTAAGDLLGLAFGPWAQKALGLFVAIAALTSINATMFVGARTNFAVGSDWKALRKLGQWELDIGSPKQALTLQALISMGLIALGTQEADGFSAMVEFTAPVFWGFLFLVGLALLWLRQADPSTPRPFKVPLYPVLPLIFCAACAWLTYSSVTYAISQKAIHVSLWLIASGVVALLLLRAREKTVGQLPHQI
ncbi:APC family permease [Limnohabitans sp. 2KL-51]|jgi:amino acid transporter|uniref:APC family permease n=1 Tax=Limnohabitans sp. 2KL-51 TaxID=1977911 RepID=UPI000D3C6CCA|nr:amino acid permease [Limnohabitans sp. 2KL-51]PUE48631.1 amino acid permease [Limnohabitans sp. 2KL-51]